VKTFKLLKIDLRNGLWGKWRYLAFAAACLFCCYVFGIFRANLTSVYGITGFHLADCLAYVIHGTIPGVRLLASSQFELSSMWMLLMMFEFLMPLDYPAKSMELWGYPYILRTSRRAWWNAKCLYTLGVVVITELIKLAVVAVYCGATGLSLSLINNAAVYEIIFGAARLNLSGPLTWGQNALLLMVVPALGVMAMSMVQLFLSVWLHPIVAYLTTIVWLIASVFLIHPLLLGNCTMPIRNGLIDTEGLATGTEIFACLAFIAVFWLLGARMVKKKDIFVMKKED
jgi:hypothetical protein